MKLQINNICIAALIAGSIGCAIGILGVLNNISDVGFSSVLLCSSIIIASSLIALALIHNKDKSNEKSTT